jgi:alpha-N-acetylglucosamine transferase
VLITYAVIVLIVITTYGIFWKKHGAIPISLLHAFSDSIPHSGSSDIKLPVTTASVTDLQLSSAEDLATKQKASRFAYAQYATNLDYLCNTVSTNVRVKEQNHELNI